MIAQIVGVDCATQPRQTGLVRALRVGPGEPWRVEAAEVGKKRPSPADRIASWRAESGPTLVALDSPLGWPSKLGRILAQHRAGQLLDDLPDNLFLRQTDHVARRLGCAPFSVGADRIARTAHSALALISQLRTRSPIELAWVPGDLSGDAMIEVYPKATLRAHGLWRDKTRNDPPTRLRILDALRDHSVVSQPCKAACQNPHVFDAVICALAAIDFIEGTVRTPAEAGIPREVLEREGFIWTKRVA